MMPCGIGMGHTSRCIALAGKFPEDVEIIFASYGCGYEILKEHGKYPLEKLPDIKFYGQNGGFDIKYTAKKSIDAPFIFLKSIYHESQIIKKFKPDIIVADAHYSVPITARVLGIPCIIITNELTLNFSSLYPQEKPMEYLENGLKKFIIDVTNQCNAILIPDIQNSIEIPTKLRKKVIFTGPFLKQNPQKIDDKYKLREKFGFERDNKIVLVTVGGSKFGKRLLRLAHQASDAMECDKIVMITGPQIDSQWIPQSDKIVKKMFLENIMEWMKISDLIISLAGHNTTMEIAALGIPSIVVPIENHSEQLKNAQTMKKYGISIIKEINNLNPGKLAQIINKILENENLEKNEQIRKEFSGYDGTGKAVQIILENAA